MKTSKWMIHVKKISFILLPALILFSFTGCSNKTPFLTSSVVPAARGYIKVSRDNNKNYVIQVHLTDLAESERLTPPKKTYIVWLVTDQNVTKSLGQIDSSKKTMSKGLSASFESVSAFKPIRIIISAEDQADVTYPGPVIVLSTDNF